MVIDNAVGAHKRPGKHDNINIVQTVEEFSLQIITHITHTIPYLATHMLLVNPDYFSFKENSEPPTNKSSEEHHILVVTTSCSGLDFLQLELLFQSRCTLPNSSQFSDLNQELNWSCDLRRALQR